MSKLLAYAENELNLALSHDKDSEGDNLHKSTKDSVLELMKVFTSQGHSGFSASYVLNTFYRLANWKPLTPLTGEDSEWDYDNAQKDTQDPKSIQNKRSSDVFKREDGKAHYLHMYRFSDDGGKSWFTGKGSDVEITFPFDVPDRSVDIILSDPDENREKAVKKYLAKQEALNAKTDS